MPQVIAPRADLGRSSRSSAEGLDQGRERLARRAVDLQQRCSSSAGGPAVDDRERPRLEGKPGDGPDLERRADDEQQPRPRASSVARSIAPGGRSSPNSVDARLQDLAAVAAERRGRSSSCARTASRPSVQRQLGHTAERIEPCTSTTSRLPARECSVSMFWVTTARTSPRRSSSASAWCPGSAPPRAAGGSARGRRPRPAPDRAGTPGSRRPRAGRPRPDPGRRAEVGDPALRGDARARQDDARLALAQERG